MFKPLLIFIVMGCCSSVAGFASSETIQEEFNGSVHQPRLEFGFKDTYWTGWNKFWFATYVGTNITDIYTSQEAFDRGCTEANPIMPESLGGMIATKAVISGIAYYVMEKHLVPAYGNGARNWIYGPLSVILGAVSISNNGCGR